jgi:hypothetical protein
MNLLRRITLASLTGMMVNCPVSRATPKTLNLAEINSIAKQTTVIVSPQLTKKDLQDLLENKPKPDGKNWGVGSGVIVGKQGKTYYVLTVAHNFLNDRVKANHPYGIVTSDRQVHIVTKINDQRGDPDCPKSYQELISKPTSNSILMRFGCSKYVGIKKTVYGIDLAVVTFESDKNYPVASLGDINNVSLNDTIYISGWPKLEDEPKLNQDGSIMLDSRGNVVCQGIAPRRQRRLAWGPLKDKVSFSEQRNGYSLIYFDYTREGMSGGPVFDQYGQLIGIHGQGSQKPVCGQPYQSPLTEEGQPTTTNDFEFDDDWGDWGDNSESDDDWFADDSFESDDNWDDSFESDDDWFADDFEADNSENSASNSSDNYSIGYSKAQNISDSQRLIEEVGYQVPFIFTPPSQELIKAGLIVLDNSQLQGSDNTAGRAEFDPQQGAFDDPQDVVEDIYKIFQFNVDSMLRVIPSGGCGSVSIPCNE